MYSLKEWVEQKYYEPINEGGLGGHMAHPIDYSELTFGELKDMVTQLFSGQIEDMKEKLDGTNIQATVNIKGDVVFMYNKGDLNSENGGMSIEDMAKKWSDKPSVAKNYIKAGEIIKKIFSKLPNSYFNPDENTKIIVNCECISAGQTNVMLYDSDRVAFHGISIYKKDDKGKWQIDSKSEGEPKEIRKAAEGIKEALPRPKLNILDMKEAKIQSNKAILEINKILKSYHLSDDSTIEDYKKIRYDEIAPLWARNDECYERLVNGNKSVNLRELKKKYPHLPEFEKSTQAKGLYRDIMEPLEALFSSIGNALISLLSGFTNDSSKDKVIAELRKQAEEVKQSVENDGTDEMKDVVTRSLKRLSKLEDKLNAAEGIVYQYNGKLMKLTGSFSALNQLFGVKFMKR